MAYTSDDLTGLGAKLDALELTDGESAALQAIFDAATPDDDEVAGYSLLAASPSTATFSFAINRFRSFGASNQAITDGTSNTLLFDEADSLFGKRTNG